MLTREQLDNIHSATFHSGADLSEYGSALQFYDAVLRRTKDEVYARNSMNNYYSQKAMIQVLKNRMPKIESKFKKENKEYINYMKDKRNQRVNYFDEGTTFGQLSQSRPIQWGTAFTSAPTLNVSTSMVGSIGDATDGLGIVISNGRNVDDGVNPF